MNIVHRASLTSNAHNLALLRTTEQSDTKHNLQSDGVIATFLAQRAAKSSIYTS